MYKLILELSGKSYLLSSVNIGKYNRGSEYEPSPADNSLQLQIRTLKMDNFLWSWIGGESIIKKNGKIKLIDVSNEALLQTYSFEQGYCISSNLSFYNASDASEVGISLQASKISIEIHEQVSPVLGERGSSNQ
ncbi:MAG: hypothetical protein KF856_03260 [Cyclobacteriaceae bacterium]|nr:hypothetical protein [Cyclobacteriaceae bacterium]